MELEKQSSRLTHTFINGLLRVKKEKHNKTEQAKIKSIKLFLGRAIKTFLLQ